MESGGNDIESVPGKSLSDDQDTGATIPLMMVCTRSKNHDAAKELGKNNGASCPAHYDAVECNSKEAVAALLSKEAVEVPKVNMEMVDFDRTPLNKAA